MKTTRAFRFMVTVRNAPDTRAWREKAARLEALGYDQLNIPDHLASGFAVIPALTVAAAATTRLRVSGLVFANDYRNPVLFAKEIATLDLLSDGRTDVGLGTGWYEPDYAMMGLPLDPPATRVARLAEAIPLLKRLWTEERVDHDGTHYRTRGATVLPRTVQRPHPPILIGASRPAMLRLAAQHADILSYVFPSERRGALDPSEITEAALDEKLELVRTAAGPRYDDITLSLPLDIALTDDATSRYDDVAAKAGVPTELLRASPFFAFGSLEAVRERLLTLRERFGATFHRVREEDAERFAPLVASLRGA